MALIWALNFSISKQALATLPPLPFNALRFPLAAAVVTVALRWRGGVRLPPREDRWRLIGLGVLANVLYQLLFIFGLAHTRAGTASVLLAGTPMATAVLAAATGQERVTRSVWVGAAATLLGIALVAGAATPEAGETRPLLGNLLLLSATAAWAVYAVASRDLIRKHGALPVTAWTLWAGSVGIVLAGLPSLLHLEPGVLTPAVWLAIVYAGALSIGTAYVLWSYGLRQIGPTRAGTYSNLVPVFALVAAWLWLGERPTLMQVLGAAIIIGGVTLAQARIRRPSFPVLRSPAP